MECLAGETLAHRLLRGALPLEEVMQVAMQLADALDAAHRAGLTHRDLKPANVVLTTTGAKVLDFGLAKWRGSDPDSGISGAQVTAHSTLTQIGTVVGTIQYMAPEQLGGKPVGAQADLFALGAIVYEMTTGRKAFDGTNASSVMAAILTSTPPPMSASARIIGTSRSLCRCFPVRDSALTKSFRRLPIGVQIVVKRWREDVALAVAALLRLHSADGPPRPSRDDYSHSACQGG